MVLFYYMLNHVGWLEIPRCIGIITKQELAWWLCNCFEMLWLCFWALAYAK